MLHQREYPDNPLPTVLRRAQKHIPPRGHIRPSDHLRRFQLLKVFLLPNWCVLLGEASLLEGEERSHWLGVVGENNCPLGVVQLDVGDGTGVDRGRSLVEVPLEGFQFLSAPVDFFQGFEVLDLLVLDSQILDELLPLLLVNNIGLFALELVL